MTRLAIVLLVIVLVAGGAFGLHKLFTARDNSAVNGATTATAGGADAGKCPAQTAEIPRDGVALSPGQIATAIARGNVVLLSSDPATLRRFQADESGRYDAELAAAGQMVVLGKADLPAGRVDAKAWGRNLQAAPGDPALRDFTESLLGKGAGKACP